MGVKKVLGRLEFCHQFGAPREKIFSVQTTNYKVQPVADKRTKKGENDRVGAFKEAAVHQRRRNHDGSFSLEESAKHQRKVSVLVEKFFHEKVTSKVQSSSDTLPLESFSSKIR